MAYSFDKPKQVSSSDLTISQNIELRTLLNECNRLSRRGDLVTWRWTLDSLQRELTFDLNKMDSNEDKNENKYSTRLKVIEEKLCKEIKDKEKTYVNLSAKEVILREVQEECGKGSRRIYSDDDDDE